MKNNQFIIWAALTASMMLSIELEGRGSRAPDFSSGERGRGRTDFSDQSFSRSPSMSRAQVPQRFNYSSPQPQRQVSQQIQQAPRPQESNVRSQILQSERRTQAGSQAGVSRQQVQQYIQRSPMHTNYHTSVANHNAFNQVKQRLPQDIKDRNQIAQNVRQGFDKTNRNWFNNDFWRKHGYYPNYWRNGYNWSSYPSWSGINGWLGYDWGSPIYYNEGVPIYANSDDGTDYLLAPPQYQPPSEEVANTGGEGEAPSDWMPLGDFAIVNDVNDAANANMFFQLALAKDGSIAGSYYNQTIDQVYPIEGAVDQTTQEAAWKMSQGEGAPIFETGLFNLTKDQTPVQVTYSDGSVQTWLLIRM